MAWYFLYYGSILSALIPLLFGLVALRYNQQKGFISLIGLILVSFITDVTCYVYYYNDLGSTYWIINLYAYFLIPLIGLTYYRLSTDSDLFIVGSLICFIALNYRVIQDFEAFHGDVFALISFFTILFSCLSFYEIFIGKEEIYLEKDPFFWVNSGFLIYGSGSLFSYLLSHNILIGNESTWMLHNLANILKNLLFAVGLWKARQAASAIQP